MGEFAMLLKRSGRLYLGIPVGKSGLFSAGCRYYDHVRFANLTEGWRLIATYAPPNRWRCCPYPRLLSNETEPVMWPGSTFWEARPYGTDDWHYQPIFVLEKTSRSASAALKRVVPAR